MNFSADNSISGAQGAVAMVINGKSYTIGSMVKLEAKLSIDSTEIRVIGGRMKKHKAGMMNGTFSGTMHYNLPMVRTAFENYKKTGKLPRMKITVRNEDKASTVGKQRVVLKECLPTEGILALLDAESDSLTEDISGTFDDFEITNKFKTVDGDTATLNK